MRWNRSRVNRWKDCYQCCFLFFWSAILLLFQASTWTPVRFCCGKVVFRIYFSPNIVLSSFPDRCCPTTFSFLFWLLLNDFDRDYFLDTTWFIQAFLSILLYLLAPHIFFEWLRCCSFAWHWRHPTFLGLCSNLKIQKKN